VGVSSAATFNRLGDLQDPLGGRERHDAYHQQLCSVLLLCTSEMPSFGYLLRHDLTKYSSSSSSSFGGMYFQCGSLHKAAGSLVPSRSRNWSGKDYFAPGSALLETIMLLLFEYQLIRLQLGIGNVILHSYSIMYHCAGVCFRVVRCQKISILWSFRKRIFTL